MEKNLQLKLSRLKKNLLTLGSVLVAYSGGVDSTLLLKVASDLLKHKVLAITAQAASFPKRELEFAKKMAEKLKVRFKIIETNELANSQFVKNKKDRCYWCKKELFTQLKKIAQKEKLKYVVDGSNADDAEDFRPGAQAVAELGIRSPLKEAGLTKEEIRRISYEMGLTTWNKPAQACLASRIPFGTEIAQHLLEKINRAEEFLKKFGLRQVRVRHHGDLARIEVLEKDFKKLISEKNRPKIAGFFKKLGYFYVTLDLLGYRPGSLNEVLIKNEKKNLP